MNLTFVNLQKPVCSDDLHKFADMLLEKGIINDKLLESIYIPLIVRPYSAAQMIYRAFWSETFLRRDFKTSYQNRGDGGPDWVMDDLFQELPPEAEVPVMMSISECIDFIYKATPAALQEKIPENIKSIQNIWDLMHYFFFEEKDPRLSTYNLTTFYSVFHMEAFENRYKADRKRIKFLRSLIKKYDMDNYGTLLGCVDASTIEIDKIMEQSDSDETTPAYVQMSFHANVEEDIEILYDFLCMNEFSITGVECDQTGVYVSAYCQCLNHDICNFIKSIYSNL